MSKDSSTKFDEYMARMAAVRSLDQGGDNLRSGGAIPSSNGDGNNISIGGPQFSSGLGKSLGEIDTFNSKLIEALDLAGLSKTESALNKNILDFADGSVFSPMVLRQSGLIFLGSEGKEGLGKAESFTGEARPPSLGFSSSKASEGRGGGH